MEDDEVNEWLSEIFGEEVILMKSEKERLMPLTGDGDKKLPYMHKDDRR